MKILKNGVYFNDDFVQSPFYMFYLLVFEGKTEIAT